MLGRLLGDVAGIVAAVGRPVEELVAYGRSVGSIFARELADRFPKIAGLVLESGIADVLERLLLRLRPEALGVTGEDLAEAVQRRLDHRAKLASYRGPLLVMHARDDAVVDPSHAVRNHDWASSQRKQLTWFERGGHNNLMGANWPAYVDALRHFVAGLR
jgi:pimeloyl-ACP methyl ester carboxylesterase